MHNVISAVLIRSYLIIAPRANLLTDINDKRYGKKPSFVHVQVSS